MTEEPIEKIVTEVLKRLLPRLGADGSRGSVIVVFTGATVGTNEAINQMRALILGGFRLELVFSEMAEHLYGPWLRDQLDGFPQWSLLPAFAWLKALREAQAVLVPLISVNTLSKLSLLIADSQTGNLILHGLFTGKPVVIARNGVEADQPGRAELGFNHGRPELTRAIDERLKLLATYGCVLVDASNLSATADALISREGVLVATGLQTTNSQRQAPREVLKHERRLITAGDVLEAHRRRVDIECSSTTLVTPLARDLAATHEVCILRDEPIEGHPGGLRC